MANFPTSAPNMALDQYQVNCLYFLCNLLHLTNHYSKICARSTSQTGLFQKMWHYGQFRNVSTKYDSYYCRVQFHCVHNSMYHQPTKFHVFSSKNKDFRRGVLQEHPPVLKVLKKPGSDRVNCPLKSYNLIFKIL